MFEMTYAVFLIVGAALLLLAMVRSYPKMRLMQALMVTLLAITLLLHANQLICYGISLEWLNGFASAGKIVADRYYVGNRGVYHEVSKETFLWDLHYERTSDILSDSAWVILIVAVVGYFIRPGSRGSEAAAGAVIGADDRQSFGGRRPGNAFAALKHRGIVFTTLSVLAGFSTVIVGGTVPIGLLQGRRILWNAVFAACLAAITVTSHFMGRKWWAEYFIARADPKCCQHCGYCLISNLSGICPECGTPIPKPPDPKSHQTA